MFLDWNQHTANKFPYRVSLLSGWWSESYKELELEMENRKKWILDNSTEPIMLANDGHILCFSCAADAVAFKLRWV